MLLQRQEKTDYRFHKEKILNVSQTQTSSNPYLIIYLTTFMNSAYDL